MTGQMEPISNVRKLTSDPSVLVAEAAGEIDLHRSADFQRGLIALVEQRPGTIVLDLTGVAYMDSSGVASLVKLLARVRREKIGLKLVGMSRRVQSVFQITKLDTVFEIHRTMEEALSP